MLEYYGFMERCDVIKEWYDGSVKKKIRQELTYRDLDYSK